MEQQLIALYLLVCRAYDTKPDLKYQRLSNFRPRFTDEELLTIYLFGHMQGLSQQRHIYDYAQRHWRAWFPALPSYQACNRRLNQLRAARVAREVADQGYCSTKRSNYYGVKLHTIAPRRTKQLPLQAVLHLSRVSQHDLSALRQL